MKFPHYPEIENKIAEEGFDALTDAESLIWLAGTDQWDDVAVDMQYGLVDPNEPAEGVTWDDLREWDRVTEDEYRRDRYDIELESAYIMSGFRKLREEYRSDAAEGGELHDEAMQAIDSIIEDLDEGYHIPDVIDDYRDWMRDIEIVHSSYHDCFQLMRNKKNGKRECPVDEVRYRSVEEAKAAAAALGYHATLSQETEE